MILIIQLCAVFTLPQEYFPAARVHLRILCDVIHLALKNCPAVIISAMLRNFFRSVKNIVCILNHVFNLFCFLHEFLKNKRENGTYILRSTVFDRHFGSHRKIKFFIIGVLVSCLRQLAHVKSDYVMYINCLAIIFLLLHNFK